MTIFGGRQKCDNKLCCHLQQQQQKEGEDEEEEQQQYEEEEEDAQNFDKKMCGRMLTS